ncbi:hypothetical protein LXL04_004656 [Taraxacum kok-saghyz]
MDSTYQCCMVKDLDVAIDLKIVLEGVDKFSKMLVNLLRMTRLQAFYWMQLASEIHTSTHKKTHKNKADSSGFRLSAIPLNPHLSQPARGGVAGPPGPPVPLEISRFGWLISNTLPLISALDLRFQNRNSKWLNVAPIEIVGVEGGCYFNKNDDMNTKRHMGEALVEER